MGGIMTDNWKRIIADKDAETAEACEEEAAKQEKSHQQQELSALFLAAEVSGKELAEAIGVPWQPGSVDECGHVVGRDERHFPRIVEEWMRRLRAINSHLKANGWDGLLDKVRENYAQRVLLVIRDGATSKEIRPLIDKQYLHWSMLEDVSADLRALIWPAPQPVDPEDAGETDTAAHSDDFRSVNWFGTPHGFTPTQAACVKILWKHWEQNTPDVGQDTILEAVESAQGRLDYVFKNGKHPAWGTMIVKGSTKGAFRLAKPT